MATLTIDQRSDLTAESAQQLFKERFAGRYEVYPTRMRNRHFVVKKSEWTGVGVKVKQGQNGSTTFVFTALMPNLLLQGLFGGLISYLFLRRDWKALEREVASFIEGELGRGEVKLAA